MIARARIVLVAAVVVIAVVTVLLPVMTPVHYAYRGEIAHIVIETAATLISLLAAFILLGRYRQTHDRGELLLFIGLVLLFAANFARSVAPSYSGGNEGVVWIPLAANLIASGVLVAAAFAPAGEIRGRRALRTAAAILGGAALVLVVMGLIAERLPTGVDPGLTRSQAETTRVVGSVQLLASQLLSMALFAAAAYGFARRVERTGDEFLAWLAAGMGLAAVSRLHYFLFPSVYSEWVFGGDILRFLAYLAILIGALRQIAAYQRDAARAAVLDERGRIARDLHDGLAQDLAFISLQGQRLAQRDERAAGLAEAARHALAASRGAIENLRLTDAPLGTALANVATAIAGRHRVELILEIDDRVDVPAPVRDDLVRIASEAISNAVRHGDAGEIRVVLSTGPDGQVRLAVADNGSGFDPDSVTVEGPGGLGLPGMHERAELLGAILRIDSAPGRGTTIAVTVP